VVSTADVMKGFSGFVLIKLLVDQHIITHRKGACVMVA
jgi:hypothetical protein